MKSVVANPKTQKSEAAPIKLSEGIITNDETKEGYGLKHMEARRGEEIRKAGYKSVTEFVEFVARHYDSRNIKIGKRRKNEIEKKT